FSRRSLYESDRIALRVAEPERLCTVGISPDEAGLHAMAEQVVAHCLRIIGGEGDFGEPILCLRRGGVQEHPLLRLSNEKTGLRASVLRAIGSESKNFGIELAGFLDVANVDGDVIDAGDARSRRLFFCARRQRAGSHAQRKKTGCALYTGDLEKIG